MLHSFPPGVAEKLKTYVYRLIDPRNGETFYVGKGKGDRVFAHIQAKIKTDDPGDKLKRIPELTVAEGDRMYGIRMLGQQNAADTKVEGILCETSGV